MGDLPQPSIAQAVAACMRAAESWTGCIHMRIRTCMETVRCLCETVNSQLDCTAPSTEQARKAAAADLSKSLPDLLAVCHTLYKGCHRQVAIQDLFSLLSR